MEKRSKWLIECLHYRVNYYWHSCKSHVYFCWYFLPHFTAQTELNWLIKFECQQQGTWMQYMVINLVHCRRQFFFLLSLSIKTHVYIIPISNRNMDDEKHPIKVLLLWEQINQKSLSFSARIPKSNSELNWTGSITWWWRVLMIVTEYDRNNQVNGIQWWKYAMM